MDGQLTLSRKCNRLRRRELCDQMLWTEMTCQHKPNASNHPKNAKKDHTTKRITGMAPEDVDVRKKQQSTNFRETQNSVRGLDKVGDCQTSA